MNRADCGRLETVAYDMEYLRSELKLLDVFLSSILPFSGTPPSDAIHFTVAPLFNDAAFH